MLDKGATHVAVLDIPDVTLTPRFQQVLAGVTQQADLHVGGAGCGAAVQSCGRLVADLLLLGPLPSGALRPPPARSDPHAFKETKVDLGADTEPTQFIGRMLTDHWAWA